ncbi:MAG: DUF3775 domain-containing protein [Rhodospirillales bacterium]|nr:DUF3775 domain-containing protein [Rhodospirillales bacterium]
MQNLSLDKICFIIAKAREFDVKVEPVIPDPGGNPTDDGEVAVLSDYDDDSTYFEVHEFISGLNRDEQNELVAMAWLGRGDFDKSEWDDIVQQADDAHNETTAEYLLGMPLLSDYLEESLDQFELNCED